MSCESAALVLRLLTCLRRAKSAGRLLQGSIAATEWAVRKRIDFIHNQSRNPKAPRAARRNALIWLHYWVRG